MYVLVLKTRSNTCLFLFVSLGGLLTPPAVSMHLSFYLISSTNYACFVFCVLFTETADTASVAPLLLTTYMYQTIILTLLFVLHRGTWSAR